MASWGKWGTPELFEKTIFQAGRIVLPGKVFLSSAFRAVVLPTLPCPDVTSKKKILSLKKNVSHLEEDALVKDYDLWMLCLTGEIHFFLRQ